MVTATAVTPTRSYSRILLPIGNAPGGTGGTGRGGGASSTCIFAAKKSNVTFSTGVRTNAVFVRFGPVFAVTVTVCGMFSSLSELNVEFLSLSWICNCLACLADWIQLIPQT